MRLKNIIKRVTVFFAALILTAAACGTSFAGAGSWQLDDGGWWYAFDDGGYAAGGWAYIDGYWYFFDYQGYMMTGWVNDGSGWYFLNPYSGAMATGWIWDFDGWYYMSAQGTMTTGWVYDNGSLYYLDPYTGIMVTGWLQIDGSLYYFNEWGALTDVTDDDPQPDPDDTDDPVPDPDDDVDEDDPYYYEGFENDLSGITPEQQRLLETIFETPTTGEGFCAAWVSNVLSAFGIDMSDVYATRKSIYSYAYDNDLTTEEYEYDSDFNANDYWAYVCYSEALQDLKPGMIVATRNSYSYLGRQFGHVGFYVGNNQIISSVGELLTSTVSDFADEFNNAQMGSTVRWGFAPTMFE